MSLFSFVSINISVYNIITFTENCADNDATFPLYDLLPYNYDEEPSMELEHQSSPANDSSDSDPSPVVSVTSNICSAQKAIITVEGCCLSSSSVMIAS